MSIDSTSGIRMTCPNPALELPHFTTVIVVSASDHTLEPKTVGDSESESPSAGTMTIQRRKSGLSPNSEPHLPVLTADEWVALQQSWRGTVSKSINFGALTMLRLIHDEPECANLFGFERHTTAEQMSCHPEFERHSALFAEFVASLMQCCDADGGVRPVSQRRSVSATTRCTGSSAASALITKVGEEHAIWAHHLGFTEHMWQAWGMALYHTITRYLRDTEAMTAWHKLIHITVFSITMTHNRTVETHPDVYRGPVMRSRAGSSLLLGRSGSSNTHSSRDQSRDILVPRRRSNTLPNRLSQRFHRERQQIVRLASNLFAKSPPPESAV